MGLAGRIPTVNKVKYSHHPDGRAHFSQHGKVKTSIINPDSMLLDDPRGGHLFTLRVQGLDDFECVSGKDRRDHAPKRAVLQACPGHLPAAVKVICHLYPRGHRVFQQPRKDAFFVSSPAGSIASRFGLTLFWQEVEPFNIGGKSGINLYGGFDRREVQESGDRSCRFLCLAYPIQNFAGLTAQFGSIDLQTGGAS
jgi:hypothetical protein